MSSLSTVEQKMPARNHSNRASTKKKSIVTMVDITFLTVAPKVPDMVEEEEEAPSPSSSLRSACICLASSSNRAKGSSSPVSLSFGANADDVVLEGSFWLAVVSLLELRVAADAAADDGAADLGVVDVDDDEDLPLTRSRTSITGIRTVDSARGFSSTCDGGGGGACSSSFLLLVATLTLSSSSSPTSTVFRRFRCLLRRVVVVVLLLPVVSCVCAGACGLFFSEDDFLAKKRPEDDAIRPAADCRALRLLKVETGQFLLAVLQ